jgi:hypothetical protein
MLEIILDLHELGSIEDDLQREIILNWNQSKLNKFLKGQLVGTSAFTIKNVEHIELALFDDEVILLIVYEQQRLFSNKPDFVKVKFNINEEILILSWQTSYWTIERQKIK